MSKSILHSKWFTVFEIVSTLVVVGIAFFMIMNKSPQYEDVPKTYSNMTGDLQTRNTMKSRYTAYAKQAEKEGRHDLKRLFLAGADSQGAIIEREYAMVNRLSQRSMPAGDSVNTASTKEALEILAGNNMQKPDAVYRKYASDAKEEKHREAEKLFQMSGQAAWINEELFIRLQTEQADNNLPVYSCESCGALYMEERPKMCRGCNLSGEKLKEYL